MDFETYQSTIRRCATHPVHHSEDRNARLICYALGAVEEAIELLTAERPEDVRAELGDVCWYLAMFADVLHMKLDCTMTRSEPTDTTFVPYIVHHCGKLAGHVKKRVFHGQEATASLRDHLTTAWDWAQRVAGSQAAFDAVLEENIAKLRTRYPEAFARDGGA